MTTETESAIFVYDGGNLLAVIKRDTKVGGGIVYMTKHATVEQIASLINPKQN